MLPRVGPSIALAKVTNSVHVCFHLMQIMVNILLMLALLPPSNTSSLLAPVTSHTLFVSCLLNLSP
jgi:hypothetical protein